MLTIFCPPAARNHKTYANTEFEMVIMSLLDKVYKQNVQLPKEERPFILQAKKQLDVNGIDVLDDALLGIGRTALHKGHSDARKLFFKLFALYVMIIGASMQLEAPNAPAPVMGAGKNNAYFSVVQKIRASETGQVSRQASSSVHLATRHAWLYGIAAMLSQAMVLRPYTFSSR